MQTTLESKGWARASRFAGAMTYYRLSLGKMAVWVALILFGLQVVSAVMMAVVDAYTATGVTGNFSGALLVAFISACWITGKGTTFLTRYGTPRTSAWLGGLASLWLWSVAFLLMALVTDTVLNGAALLLSEIAPERVQIASYYPTTMSSRELFTSSLVDTFRTLPWHVLWLAEWSCVFYFLGACLRRNRWLTIGLLVGLPMVMFLSMLIPAVRQTIAAVENASESELAVLGVQWMALFARISRWAANNWQWVQGGLAVVALPLGWLVARGTPQP